MSKISQKPVQPQSQPKLPYGHFDRQGQSQGKASGAVRPQADACNERKERK